jgi:transposase
MAICEKRLSDGQYRPYTEEELKRAIAMFEDGQPWTDIANILNRGYSSLTVTVHRYKNGTWKPPKTTKQQKIRKELERLVEAGVINVAVLATIFGISENTMNQRLWTMGLTADVRKEIAQETKLAA